MLSVDIAGAFDTANHTRLLDNLCIKGLLRWLIQIIGSFLHQHSTTFVVDGKEIRPRNLCAGVPQGSPLSPIIFLFYNGPLLEKLIETGKVDVDSKGSTGRTPLSWAAEAGR